MNSQRVTIRIRKKLKEAAVDACGQLECPAISARGRIETHVSQTSGRPTSLAGIWGMRVKQFIASFNSLRDWPGYLFVALGLSLVNHLF